MTRRLLVSIVAVVLFVLIVHDAQLVVALARAEGAKEAWALERDANALATSTRDALASDDLSSLRAVMVDYTERTGTAGAVLGADQAVLLRSPAQLSDAGDWSYCAIALAAAFSGRAAATSTRSWRSAGQSCAAIPLVVGGHLRGVLCLLNENLRGGGAVQRHAGSLLSTGALTLVAVALSSRFVARSVTERAETQLEAQRGFVADASHQLRTPLAAANLRLGHLRRTLRDDPAQRAAVDAVDAVQAELARFHRLVEGLLALARAEGTRRSCNPISLGRLLVARAEAWRPLGDEQRIRIAVTADASALAFAEAEALSEAIDNLIANAFEVSPPETTLHLSTATDGAWTEIHVIDEGPGLPDADRAHAFERFWTGRRGGTGLGLAVVRQIACSCGGEARLDKAPSGGIDAVIRLRRAG